MVTRRKTRCWPGEYLDSPHKSDAIPVHANTSASDIPQYLAVDRAVITDAGAVRIVNPIGLDHGICRSSNKYSSSRIHRIKHRIFFHDRIGRTKNTNPMFSHVINDIVFNQDIFKRLPILRLKIDAASTIIPNEKSINHDIAPCRRTISQKRTF